MMSKKTLIRISILAGAIAIFLILIAVPGWCGSLDDSKAGTMALRRGDLDQAIKLYTQAINSGHLQRNELARITYLRGNAFLMMGEYDRVIEDASRAIELAPKGKSAAYAYYIRAVALKNKQQFDRAIKDHNKSIELKPEYVDAYYGRGLTWVEKGHKELALADFTKAITLNPEYASVYRDRGNVWAEKGDLDRALLDYDKALELDSTDYFAYFNRGRLYLKKGDYDLAINDLREAVKLNPEDSEAYANIGTAWLMKKSYHHAISNLTKAIQLNPNLADAYFNRCIAYTRNNQQDESLRDAKRFIQIAPNHPRVSVMKEIVRKSELQVRHKIVKDKMSLFYVSLVFLGLYIAILMKSGTVEGLYRTLAGVSYFIFCVLFVIFIHLHWSSVWRTVLSVIFVFILAYVLQIISGSLVHQFRKRH